MTDFLLRREYPGNIRELRFLMARVAARHIGQGPITVGSLPEAERPAGERDSAAWWHGGFEEAVESAVTMGVGLREIGRVAQQTAVAVAVTAEQGNLRRASRLLGVTERALQMRRSSGNLSLPSSGTADPEWLPGADPRSTDRLDPLAVPRPATAPDDEGDRPLSPGRT